MSKHSRDRRPYIKPVTKMELSESNIKFRWIAIALLLAIAVVSIGYGFSQLLQTEIGWQMISPAEQAVNCSDDFVLMYEFGTENANPTAEYKKLEALYQELTETGYRLFHVEAEGADNLYAINASVNQPVTVAPALYAALEQIVASGSRYVFLAPVQELYESLFLCTADGEAEMYDPMKSPERAALVREMAAFCADPEMISLELLGNEQVCLKVSAEYLAYGQECGIEEFLNLGWMRNAFIADFMAEELYNAGFTKGYLGSIDGYTRNLDSRGTEFTLNLFHRVGSDVRMPANFFYTGPMSVVMLRDYPMSEQDQWNYYAYEDGTITSLYLDSADGMNRTSIDGILAYSLEKSCSQIALELAPVFIAESFDAEALEGLAEEGIESVCCSDNVVVCTDEAAPFKIVDERYSLTVRNSK